MMRKNEWKILFVRGCEWHGYGYKHPKSSVKVHYTVNDLLVSFHPVSIYFHETFILFFFAVHWKWKQFSTCAVFGEKTVSAAQKKSCGTETGNGLKWNLNSTPSCHPFFSDCAFQKIYYTAWLAQSFVRLLAFLFVRSSIAIHKSYDISACKSFSTTREFSSFSSFPIHVHTNTFLDSLKCSIIWNKMKISIMLCIHDGILFVLLVLD